jgi:probable HAF family extracellular repeat protein
MDRSRVGGVSGVTSVMVVCLMLLGAFTGISRPAASHVETPLSQISGVPGEAYDINDQGQVVGVMDYGMGNTAFLVNPVDVNGDGRLEWYQDTTPANGVNDLMIPLGSLTAGGFAEADAINSDGIIAGSALSPAGHEHIFTIIPEDSTGDGIPDTWFRDTSPADGVNDLMVDLGAPWGAIASWCWDISDQSTIAGCLVFAAGTHGYPHVTTEAIIDRAPMGCVLLGTLGGPNSTATAVSDTGIVVGYADSTDGRPHAFVIEPMWNGSAYEWYRDSAPADGINDLMQDLGSAGESSAANSVNVGPTIVGWTNDPVNGQQSVKWENISGVWTKTNLWPSGEAMSINELGVIAGWHIVTSAPRPLVLDDVVGLHDLDTTKGKTWSINNMGQIAGTLIIDPMWEYRPAVWTTHQQPSAVFTATPTTGRTVQFDGSLSNAWDGVIESYDWDFGDGTTGSGVAPLHTFAADGTYDVTMKVTNDDGLWQTLTLSVVVAAPNQPPNAIFTVTATDLSIVADASQSTDDGTIVAYNWNLGDGVSDSGMIVSHTYAAEGTYTIDLTAVDDDHALSYAQYTVTVSAPNVPPVPIGWTIPAPVETETLYSINPQVAVDPTGNAVAVWQQYDGIRDNIWANRYVVGAGWGSPTLIETDDTSWADHPEVVVDQNGNAIAVWEQSNGVYTSICSNRYVVGAGWSTAAPIETDDSGNACDPQVAFDPSGNAIAVWWQFNATAWHIWSNRYVVGTGWETATLVETDNVNSAFHPQIAVDPSGNAVAVWDQNNGKVDSIWANHYVPGTGWGIATLIEFDDLSYARYPQIAVDQSGNAIAVWQQSYGGDNNILANRYVVGAGWGTATLLETLDAGHAAFPQVEFDQSGNAIAVWYQNDGTLLSIYANRYVAGAGWGTATLIETEQLGYAYLPEVAVTPSGDAVVVWYQSDGIRYNIWSNHYAVDNGWGVAELIDTDNAGNATNPRVAVDQNGDAVAVWSQSYGTNSHIWASCGTIAESPPNLPPVANIEVTVDGMTATINGSSSYDPDGTIVSFLWNMITSGEAVFVHEYPDPGTYTIELWVTDNDGAVGHGTYDVVISATNVQPIASWSMEINGLSVKFNASDSNDPDGSIASYSWYFGDGSPLGAGAVVWHEYGSGGTYGVVLTVTDNQGLRGWLNKSVTVVAPIPPVVDFSMSVTGMDVMVDASSLSYDPDGMIVSYTWNFGDGSPNATGATVLHTYAAEGTFDVYLEVFGSCGSGNWTMKSVTIYVPDPPVAGFSAVPTYLSIAFDASYPHSYDTDGWIVSYDWDFGDYSTDTGWTVVHNYWTAGNYSVTLTVTDNDGLTGTATCVVTATEAPPPEVNATIIELEELILDATDPSGMPIDNQTQANLELKVDIAMDILGMRKTSGSDQAVEMRKTSGANLLVVFNGMVETYTLVGKLSGYDGWNMTTQANFVISLLASQVRITDVPNFAWYCGCAPTAAGMLMAYWDAHGFDGLVAGESGLLQTPEIENMIASPEHIWDYALVPDPNDPLRVDDSLGDLIPDNSTADPLHHENNCLADFMHTSWFVDKVGYGLTLLSRVADGLVQYTANAPRLTGSNAMYIGYSKELTAQSFKWEDLRYQIDTKHPMLLAVDVNGDGSTDHLVTAVGYCQIGSARLYAFHSTWDNTIFWGTFEMMKREVCYGVFSGFIYDIVDVTTSQA